MEIIRYLLIVVEVLCCLMLIGVILLQQSKSQGMGLAFGGGMGETLFGSRAGNVLTKITVTLALVFLANTTLLGILYTSGEEKSLVESATAAPAPLPVAPAQPQDGMITPPPASATPSMLTVDEPMPSTVSPVGQDAEIAMEVPGELPEMAEPVEMDEPVVAPVTEEPAPAADAPVVTEEVMIDSPAASESEQP